MDGRSDNELIDACNSGDARAATRAFEALYERHRDFVVRVARRFGADNDAALDTLQETFSWLLAKFPPTGPGLALTSKLTTLLYPVARNSALTLRRKAERFPASPTTPDDLPAAASATTSDIGRIVGELPRERREVVLLRFVDDLSLADIAEALDVPLGTVKSRLHLAIRQLRESPTAKKMLEP